MINSEKIKTLIEERIKLLPDDPKMSEIWNELTQIFSKNEQATIEYLNNCSECQIEWISEVFEDISENLQSEEFIDTLEKLQEKFSDLEMDISYAKETLRKR